LVNTALKRVGVIAHARRPETYPVAEAVMQSLEAGGVATWLQDGLGDSQALQDTADLLIAIGGDGAMLRAARAAAPHQLPVLGINMGYLGFLPEINPPEAWGQYLAPLLQGDYWVEQRMMLHATVMRGETVLGEGHALNDVVINRNRAIGTVLLQVYIDRHWATTYHADALIVATATGSTAYALAAGGPILPPELRNILIVPVAPHLSMDRPIVLSEGATVQVVVSAERESHATVILDGVELCAIEAHDCVLIRVSEHMGRFVRMRDQNYFYRSLLDRLEPRVPLRATPDELVFSLNHKDAKDTP
jgi:NAD+ kinase